MAEVVEAVAVDLEIDLTAEMIETAILVDAMMEDVMVVAVVE